MKNIVLNFLIFIFTIGSFNACKKDLSDSTQNTSLIEKETNAWFQAIKGELSDTVLKMTRAKIEALDFTSFKEIKQQKSNAILFVIKIKENDPKLDEYLSFAKINGRFQTIGVVRSTNTNFGNLSRNIEKFINDGSLDQNFRLSFYRLNNRHLSSYEGVANSGIKKLIVRSAEKLDKVTVNSNTLLNGAQGCTDWYIVTTYTFSDGTQYQTSEFLTRTCEGGDCSMSDPYGQNLECVNPDNSGGINVYPDLLGENYPDDGLISCKSFVFTRMTTNMYEAGVSGIKFERTLPGGGTMIHNFRVIYVGFPKTTDPQQPGGSRKYTEGQAASITAKAMNMAWTEMAVNYWNMNPVQAAAVTTTELEIEFANLTKKNINDEIDAGSTVSFYKGGTSSTITKTAVYNTYGEQVINYITGSGCK